MRFHNILLCQLHELLVSNFLATNKISWLLYPIPPSFLPYISKKSSTSFVSMTIREVVVAEEVTKESEALEAALFALFSSLHNSHSMTLTSLFCFLNKTLQTFCSPWNRGRKTQYISLSFSYVAFVRIKTFPF